jgi:sugar phosphate isomerase/epimerase
MTIITRRKFLQSASASVACTAALFDCAGLYASPFGLPIALQLYSVRQMLALDFAGTLKLIAGIGYSEVESAGYFNHTAKEVGSALQAAGLQMPSAHFPHDELSRDFDQILEFNKAIGVRYIICSFPGLKDPGRIKTPSFDKLVQSFTMEDWRWNAEEFNKMGEKVRAAGMAFGYHNHTMEFGSQGGIVPFEELLRLTDRSLVTIELDCGWVVVGGGNPVYYLERYADRISMLHVKDFKKTDKPVSVVSPPPAEELGRGTIDYRRIFAAAKKARIKHCFVEQEDYDIPVMEALKIDADYMKNFKA